MNFFEYIVLWFIFLKNFTVSTSSTFEISQQHCSTLQAHSLERGILDQVKALLNWIVSNHPVISSNSLKIAPFLTNGEEDEWSYLGNEYILLSESISPNQSTKPLLAVIPILSYCNGTQIHATNEKVEQWIKRFGNRKRDHFILIGDKKSIQQLWKVRRVNQLRRKWGFTTDSHEFVCRVEGDPTNPAFYKEVEMFPIDHLVIGSNIRGRHLRITSWAHVPPYDFISGQDKVTGDLVFDGSHVRMFHEGSLYFNFSYELHSTEEENSYGQLLENGSWTGMVGNLYNDNMNYDIAIYIGAQLLWYPMFDFVGTLSAAGVLFVTGIPKSELHWQAFLYPFQTSVWVSLTLGFFFVVGAMFVFLRISLIVKPSTTGGAGTSATLVTFQLAMEQTASLPEMESIKIFTTTWMIVTLITNSAYKSQVMSSLTFPFTEKPPETYAELAQSKYQPLLNNMGGLEGAYFQNSDSQVITQIRKKLKYYPDPIDCISQSVLNPKTVCIGWVPYLKYMVAEWASPDAKTNAIFIATSDPIMPVNVAAAFQKDSSYSEGFEPIIMAIFESGIYTYWENDVLRIHKMKGVSNYNSDPMTPLNQELKSIIENLTGGNTKKPLKMSHLKMVFAILVLGICLASGAFIGEHLVTKRQKRKKKIGNSTGDVIHISVNSILA